MATYSDARSVHNTLDSTTVDVITLTQGWSGVEITNHSAIPIYITLNGTAPVAEAEGTFIIPAASSKVFNVGIHRPDGTHEVRIIGDGNDYSVEGV